MYSRCTLRAYRIEKDCELSKLMKLAVISTVYFPKSHSDVIVSRWLEPRATDPEFGWPAAGENGPRTSIASLYIDQFPENDIGREIAERHHVPILPTIREALTLGGTDLAVDGVLLIGEHGDYPINTFGQKMYPRRELFDQIVAVFDTSGRSVPVFCDKHLSYDAASAQHMVAVAREIDFPLMAGSSISVSGFLGPWAMPDGAPLSEAIGLYYDDVEAYGYHSIEFLQSVVAKRAGGEAGIESVTAYYGDSFWAAEKTGVWSEELMHVALHQAHNREPGDLRDNVSAPVLPEPFGAQWPVAFCFEHLDGLRTTHLMLQGHIHDFALAVQEQNGRVHAGCSSASVYGENNFHANFAWLNARIESFMLTGKAPYPVEHYLLSTLAIDAAVRALSQPGVVLATPDLSLPYRL